MSTMPPNADSLKQFKEIQKQGWAHFGPVEVLTTPAAAQLVRHAGVRAGQRVLDVGCGTGVVAVTAARGGAQVTGLDLTPQLLERARENSRIAGVAVEWREGDAESLPFEDAAFDIVLSQFGHMFAPRPEVAAAEMLRVLKPGGTIAFSTWHPDLYVGRNLALISRYLPPPPPGVAPPVLWGIPDVIKERLGSRVKDIFFANACMQVPVLSLQHHRAQMERTIGPLVKLVEMLSASDPARLEKLRLEFETLTSGYVDENILRQDYLLTRAVKL